MNTKAKGNRQEHRSMQLLESPGYCCTKSGASLGVFDVVAIGPTDVVLLQCKSNDWRAASRWKAFATFAARRSARNSSTSGAIAPACPMCAL